MFDHALYFLKIQVKNFSAFAIGCIKNCHIISVKKNFDKIIFVNIRG
jgi:hypothetical protein